MGGGSGRRKDSPCFVAETIVRDLSEISRGGGGGHNFLSLRKGRGHEKWAVKGGGSCKYMPVIM